MNIALEKFISLLKTSEDEHLEFKEAKNRFDFEKLVRYCVALANEGGGKIILGVSDRQPRKIVGTRAFEDIQRTRSGILERLHLRIDIEELRQPDGRVLIFTIPSRPIGMPVQYKGAYWMRGGEDLVPMTPDVLKTIFDESQPDFSAEICSTACMDDLHPDAINRFRQMWLRHSGNHSLNGLSDIQLLSDAELIIDGDITNAALILFGTKQALGKYLAQCEVIFEYRSSEATVQYQQRKEYREGFFLYMEDIWQTINLRNDKFHFQEGLFMLEIPAFNEAVIREAVLNSVSHREYRLAGSVFIRQYPGHIEFISPGGFPPGITPENILWRQSPRNRRIAEAFSKCGLVERSGQGADRMFEMCIKEGKMAPDYSESDSHQVSLIINGKVRDPMFLRFLEKIGNEIQKTFTTADFYILDLVNREKRLPVWAKSRLPILLETGVIEKAGRKYILSKRFYQFAGKKGVYTRKRGLDRETNKQLLLRHIKDNKKEGSQLSELMDVLPALTRNQIQTLLREMKQKGIIYPAGQTKAARWYPGNNK